MPQNGLFGITLPSQGNKLWEVLLLESHLSSRFLSIPVIFVGNPDVGVPQGLQDASRFARAGKVK